MMKTVSYSAQPAIAARSRDRRARPRTPSPWVPVRLTPIRWNSATAIQVLPPTGGANPTSWRRDVGLDLPSFEPPATRDRYRMQPPADRVLQPRTRRELRPSFASISLRAGILR